MKMISLWIMIILYVAAGVNHFIHPQDYMKIMPAWLPLHLVLVNFSGLCEIVFALLLIPRSTRPFAAWLLIALLIAIFPANIQMTINYFQEHHPHRWISVARLPLQLLLIAWAYSFTRKENKIAG